MTETTQKILSHVADGIGWLTFNNPARRNAMSTEMWQMTADALDAFDRDPAVRVVVMSGSGGKSFVSGADISQFADQRRNAEQAEIYARIGDAARRRMDSLTKPIIAMVRGYCIGGGVRVALSADIRIASDDSIFGIPAARLGLGYSFDSVRRLVDVVGPAVAKDLLITARRLNAQEALRVGLATRVVPVAELESHVRETAAQIVRNAPLTIRAVKFTVDQTTLDPAQRDMARVEAEIRACFDSEDFAIGRRAFMEKRQPEFLGR
jgi:enoyl-CoA hydratase/carnithine racemase